MTVRVKRERPSQRRYHRLTAPLFVSFDNTRLRAADWSLGGLRLEGVPGQLPDTGDSLELKLELPFQGFEVRFDVTARIVRRDEAQRMFAVEFTEIGERERGLMAHFIDELVRGSMAESAETIQRIDVPVTPVSTEPDPSPDHLVPVRRWPIKSLVMATLYILLGVAVFGYSGLTVFANFFRMEIESAVITAPIETVRSPGDGYVLLTSYAPGDRIPAGAIVAHVADNELERDIDRAEIEISEQRARLAFLKERQIDELARMEDYAALDIKIVRQIKFEVEALAAEVNTASAQHDRVSELIDKGYTTRKSVEEAEQWLASATARLKSKQVELASRMELTDRGFGRRHYSGKEFVGDLERLEAEIKYAGHQIDLSERSHDVLVTHRSRLAVRSPFDGIVIEVPKVDRGTVRRGDVLAVFELDGARRIDAFLNQDEILKVGIGDEALIYVPAIDRTVRARVVEIDRTEGFVDEQLSAYTWRGPQDRSARVSLEFEGISRNLIQAEYKPGLPAIVIFEARSTNQLLNSAWRKLITLVS